MSSPASLAKAIREGKKAAFFCANCHGETGNSVYGYIPNLAGQHPVYLLKQIGKFADGRRQDSFMSGLIKLMKPEDRFNIAIYYSAQKVHPSAVKDSVSAQRGRQIYMTRCTGCHGMKGYGTVDFARLAGQHAKYVTQSLDAYRKGTKKRSSPIMGKVARGLSDDDIAGLAAYLKTMK